MDYLVTSLLIELSEQTIRDFQSSHEISDADITLRSIMEWIRLHAMKPITVRSIAHQFNYNQDDLTRLFKTNMGMNI